MRRTPLLLTSLFLIFSTLTHAQDAKRLETALATARKPSTRLLYLDSLADYFSMRDFSKGRSYAAEGLELARKEMDFSRQVNFGRLAGSSHYFAGNYDSAAMLLYQALNLANTHELKRPKALVLNDLARLYRKTKDLDRALALYNEALAIYTSLNDEEGEATILNESGVVYEYREDYTGAIDHYQRSLQIRQRMHDKVGEAYSLNFIGGAFTLQGRYPQAEEYLRRSLQLREELKDTFSTSLNLNDIGNMFQQKKQLDSARIFFERSNVIARNMGYNELIFTNYKSLAEVASDQGMDALALDYYRRYDALKDSVFNIEKTKEIEALNTRYETGKKDQQILVQQSAIQRRNAWLLGGGISSLLLIAASYQFYKRKRNEHKVELQQAMLVEQERTTRAVIEAEEHERQRIAADLHDGVGQIMSAAKMNLSVFETEIEFKDEHQRLNFERVIGMVDESCQEIRQVSHQMMPNALLLSGLSAAIRNFVQNIDPRLIKISLHTSGLHAPIPAHVESVLYRVIQEAVNNVLKHANATTLDISVMSDEDGISATIEDNGTGYRESDRVDGIGLKNMRSRIAFLKGEIEFTGMKGKGTVVAVHIPA